MAGSATANAHRIEKALMIGHQEHAAAFWQVIDPDHSQPGKCR